MKTLFEIGDVTDNGEQKSLLLEIGEGYCVYAFWQEATQSIHVIRYFSFKETEAVETLSQILESLTPSTFHKVIVCSAFPQAILTPNKFFSESYETFQTIYNEPVQAYKHDKVEEWQLVTVYSVPEGINNLLKSRFPQVQYLHTYSTALKIYNGYVADNQALVNFTPHNFSVILKKESALQLTQTYRYNSPLDVVYYLLKIASEFEIETASLHIILSGLIEKQSALFKELEQYFMNVHFVHPPEVKVPETTFPHHFFTSLYNLAACVSLVEA